MADRIRSMLRVFGRDIREEEILPCCKGEIIRIFPPLEYREAQYEDFNSFIFIRKARKPALVQKFFREKDEAVRCLGVFEEIKKAGGSVPPVFEDGGNNSIRLTYFGEQGKDFIDPVHLMFEKKRMNLNEGELNGLAKQIKLYHGLGYTIKKRWFCWGVCFLVKEKRDYRAVIVDIEDLKKIEGDRGLENMAWEIKLILDYMEAGRRAAFLREYLKDNSRAGAIMERLQKHGYHAD